MYNHAPTEISTDSIDGDLDNASRRLSSLDMWKTIKSEKKWRQSSVDQETIPGVEVHRTALHIDHQVSLAC